jgi:hypothetical protein
MHHESSLGDPKPQVSDVTRRPHTLASALELGPVEHASLDKPIPCKASKRCDKISPARRSELNLPANVGDALNIIGDGIEDQVVEFGTSQMGPSNGDWTELS